MYTEQMYENSLCHYGIKGQSWGTRRYQNKDGTYTPLGERRRLEELARTGNKVTTTSAMTDRQQAARTGNVVRVNSASPSRPYGRPTTTAGTSTVKVNKTNSVGTGKAQLSSANPTLKNTAKKSTLANSPSAKIVTTEEAQEKKTKRIKTSSTDEDTEETKKTKKSTKKKKTKAQQQAEQKAKEQEQQNQEEKKDETQNESSRLTDEQAQDYARRVIRGEFGNGQERRDKLGDKYEQVQALVNAILLKGKKR